MGEVQVQEVHFEMMPDAMEGEQHIELLDLSRGEAHV